MVEKGGLAGDPRGLIYESYRIEGISTEESRSIFLDWALGMPMGEDMAAHLQSFLEAYGPDHPDHPMTEVLREGLERAQQPPGSKGGRGRRAQSET